MNALEYYISLKKELKLTKEEEKFLIKKNVLEKNILKLPELPDKHQEVFALIGQGLKNKDILKKLNINIRCLQARRRKILKKINEINNNKYTIINDFIYDLEKK